MNKTIRKVRIRNFMCYEGEHCFDFAPGINIITGPNDVGKSTIFAAVFWAVTGKPAGDLIHTWNGEEDTSVELVFADGTEVRRGRRKGTNYYEMNGEVYKAFGSETPEEIRHAISLDEINFQGQASNLFPINLSPGQLGQVVNNHCHIGEFHKTLDRLNRDDRKIVGQIKGFVDREKELEQEISEYDWVPEAETVLKKAHRLSGKAEKQRQKIDKAGSIIGEQAKYAEIAGDLARRLLSIEGRIEKAGRLSEDLGKKKKTVNEAGKLLERIQSSLQIIQRPIPPLKEVEKAEKELKQGREKYRKAVEVIKQAQLYKNAAEDYLDRLKEYKESEEMLLDEIGPNCPVCGGLMK